MSNEQETKEKRINAMKYKILKAEQENLKTREKNNDQMFSELASLMESVQNPCLYALLENLFIKDEEFQKTFRKHRGEGGERNPAGG